MMLSHGHADTADDVSLRISHFIHSVELKGTRAQKLETLETLMAYLEVLHRSLASDAVEEPAAVRRPRKWHLACRFWAWVLVWWRL